ncbi:MAG: type IVB secretion system lipoprotein DotD [Legionellaceae bacterium]|nr:type IVB secretion system lipoprotein DotD [Legionellaceae bacterium]
MMIHRLMLLIAPLLLVACSPTTFKKPPMNTPSDDAGIKLALAATDISRSMMDVARVEKVVYPPAQDNVLSIPNAHNLQARATVDWSGPIEELTARIAHAAHYRMQVIGQVPPIPVLINLDAKDESLSELLRDIDYQAGNRASLHVFPNKQVIELRYAKFYS